MATTYSKVLGEWVKRRESSKRDKNLVAFLAVRDDVTEAVDAGYAVKTIWANMHENKRVHFGYDTFLNYVNRYIRRSSSAPDDAVRVAPTSLLAIKPVTRATQSGPMNSGQKVKIPEALPGFTFNPTPKKEDLI